MIEQPATRAEFHEELTGMPSSELEFLAEACKHDLYLHCKGALGYVDLTPRVHKAFCEFLQNDEPAKKRRMLLMARGHLKSSVGTIGNNSRLAVKFPDTHRGLITGETDTTAENFLRELKNHWENKNSTLRVLYPELVPVKFAGPGSDWSSGRASVNRDTTTREATWTAIGAGGAVVGGHYTRITGDDLTGNKAMESPAELEKVMRWVENIDPLLVNQNTDIIDFIGTRWKRRDVYAHIMQLYLDEIEVFSLDPEDENGDPIFPAKYTRERFDQLKRTPRIWFSQFKNNPLAEGQAAFPPNSLRTFTFTKEGAVTGTRNGRRFEWPLDALDVVLHADPNSGQPMAPDDAALLVTGMAPDECIFVLEARSGKPSPSEFVGWIIDAHKKWRPRTVGIEQAGQQNTAFYFEKRMREAREWFSIVPLRPKNRDKIERIQKSLEPILAERRLFVLETQKTLRTQVQFFPDLELIDELDALAYGTEEGMWQTPDTYEDQEEKVDALTLLRNRRDPVTGY